MGKGQKRKSEKVEQDRADKTDLDSASENGKCINLVYNMYLNSVCFCTSHVTF